MGAPPPAAWGVYLVTDRQQTNSRPLVDVVASALDGGIRAVQLRERDLATRELLVLAEALGALTRRYGAALLINDRIDVALACDADGVHLPSNSFAIADARTLLGPQRLIGVSTHAPAEVAAAAGADFAVFGPIYDTPAKRQFGAPVGRTALETARASTTLALFAIGGIDQSRVPEVLAHADGIAVIRVVLGAENPAKAASALLKFFSPQRHRDTE